MYNEVLEDYVDIISGKLREGKISKEKFSRLMGVVIAWQKMAGQRGLI
ncbi:MAG: hypothetical protein LC650_05465 [Actinobacteria bacterium]|nr:hypothetical protein [Actinomycetota bacterium]